MINTTNHQLTKASIWATLLYFITMLYYFGGIIMTHFVSYPHFMYVHENFIPHTQVFNQQMVWFCYFLAFLMVLASISMLWFSPKVFPKWAIWASIALSIISVGITFFLLIPIHNQFQDSGFDTTLHQRLIELSLYFQIIPTTIQVLIGIYLLNIFLEDIKPVNRWIFILVFVLAFFTTGTGWTESFVNYPMWLTVGEKD